MRWSIHGVVRHATSASRSTPRSAIVTTCKRQKSTRTPTARWIGTLLGAGLKPILRVLDWVEPDVWEKAEAHYIALARAAGARLTNATDGGDGHSGLYPSAEVRDKMSAAQRKRWAALSAQEKARIVAPMLAEGVPARVRAFRSEMMTRVWAVRRAAGYPMPAPPPPTNKPRKAKPLPLRERDPEAYHARRSEIARKAYATRRARAHVSPSRSQHAPFGSPEHKAKLSASHKGKRLTAEHRAKIGAPQKGVPKSEQAKANMRAAWARRRAKATGVVDDAASTPAAETWLADIGQYRQLALPGT